MSPRCQVRLLGGFGVELDGRPVADGEWRHRRAAALVKLLALARAHRLLREQLVDALWPDLEPEAGGANLRKAVLFARRAMGSDDAIGISRGSVSLYPGAETETDVERFDAAAEHALRSGDPVLCADAAALYGGELLPEDRYEPWAEEPRRRLRHRYLELLRKANLWDRVVELDPLDEEAHRWLMRLYADSGDRLAAMRQFERLRRALHEELGVGPDPRSVELYQEILAMEGEEPPTPGERARSLLAQGLVAWSRMDVGEAERCAGEARAIAVQEGMGRELGEASALLGMAAHSRGRWRELFRAEFLETVRERPELAEFVFDAHVCLAEFSLAGRARPDAVVEFGEDLLGLAQQAGSLHGEALASLVLGEAALFSGRLPEAEELLSRSAELHGRAGAGSGRALALERLAEAALAGGRRSRASRMLRDALALARTSTLASHVVVRVHGALVQAAPDSSSAVAAADRAEGELSGQEVCQPCSIGFLVAAAVANARAGNPAAAGRLVEQADRVAGMWQGGPWHAAVWEARGELRLAEGDPHRAAALFREAGDLFARAARPLDEARCLAAAGAAAAS